MFNCVDCIWYPLFFAVDIQRGQLKGKKFINKIITSNLRDSGVNNTYNNPKYSIKNPYINLDVSKLGEDRIRCHKN